MASSCLSLKHFHSRTSTEMSYKGRCVLSAAFIGIALLITSVALIILKGASSPLSIGFLVSGGALSIPAVAYFGLNSCSRRKIQQPLSQKKENDENSSITQSEEDSTSNETSKMEKSPSEESKEFPSITVDILSKAKQDIQNNSVTQSNSLLASAISERAKTHIKGVDEVTAWNSESIAKALNIQADAMPTFMQFCTPPLDELCGTADLMKYVKCFCDLLTAEKQVSSSNPNPNPDSQNTDDFSFILIPDPNSKN